MTAKSLFDLFLLPTGRPVELAGVQVSDPRHAAVFANLGNHAMYRFLSGKAPLDTLPEGAAYLQEDGSLHVIYTIPGTPDLSYRLPAGSFSAPAPGAASTRPRPNYRADLRQYLAGEREKIHRQMAANRPAAEVAIYDRSHGSLAALRDALKGRAVVPPTVSLWLTASNTDLLFIYSRGSAGHIGQLDFSPDRSTHSLVEALRTLIALRDPPLRADISLAPAFDNLHLAKALLTAWARAGGGLHEFTPRPAPSTAPKPIPA